MIWGRQRIHLHSSTFKNNNKIKSDLNIPGKLEYATLSKLVDLPEALRSLHWTIITVRIIINKTRMTMI